MLRVSVSLLFLSLAISSLMFNSESSPTNFSASILASSSAIGCSNSRNFRSIGSRVTSRPPPYRQPSETDKCTRGVPGPTSRGWNAAHACARNPAQQRRCTRASDEVARVVDQVAILAQQPAELIPQLARQPHRPSLAERQRRLAGRRSIFDAHFAPTPRKRLERAL